jgi:hypothetical protein
MMPSAHYVNDAEHWRQRAKEMRLLAHDATDAEARAAMQRIASDYEKLATRASQRSDGTPHDH